MIAARNLIAGLYREKKAEDAAVQHVRRRLDKGERVGTSEVMSWLKQHYPGCESVANEALRRAVRLRRKRLPQLS